MTREALTRKVGCYWVVLLGAPSNSKIFFLALLSTVSVIVVYPVRSTVRMNMSFIIQRSNKLYFTHFGRKTSNFCSF